MATRMAVASRARSLRNREKRLLRSTSSPRAGRLWRLTIVSRAFAGKPAAARHRMIYQALGDLMRDPIHALAITARAPGEPGA